jgi:hypothetical protein
VDPINLNSLYDMKTIYVLTLAGLLVGCATDLPENRWSDAKFSSPPCHQLEHEHEREARTLDDLRSVEFDLKKYRSVQSRPGQDPELALAVAISGGGQRAANFGLGALLQLERMPYRGTNNLLQEADYFSTVSGGGLPVAGYLAGILSLEARGGVASTFRYSNFLYASCSTNKCKKCSTPKEEINGKRCLYEAMREDYQAPLLQALFHPSIWFTHYDRGDILEGLWNDRFLTVQRPRKHSLTLSNIFIPRLAATLPHAPYWIANATVVGNGAIFPFTPDVIERYGTSHYTHELKRKPLGCPYELPLAVGLKTSASFPVAIPATTLKLASTKHAAYLQLSDGGLADNLGVLTAKRMLEADPATNKVLIVIDAYGDNALPIDDSASPPGALQMIARTTDISLDSWRGRYRGVMSDMCTQAGIKPVFLSFEELEVRGTNDLETSDCSLLINRLSTRQQPKRLKAQVQNPTLTEAGWFKLELAKIREKARSTPTSLRLSPAEQDIIVTAGKLLICLHQNEIRATIPANQAFQF